MLLKNKVCQFNSEEENFQCADQRNKEFEIQENIHRYTKYFFRLINRDWNPRDIRKQTRNCH